MENFLVLMELSGARRKIIFDIEVKSKISWGFPFNICVFEKSKLLPLYFIGLFEDHFGHIVGVAPHLKLANLKKKSLD